MFVVMALAIVLIIVFVRTLAGILVASPGLREPPDRVLC